jgi:hypothetical protein
MLHWRRSSRRVLAPAVEAECFSHGPGFRTRVHLCGRKDRLLEYTTPSSASDRKLRTSRSRETDYEYPMNADPNLRAYLMAVAKGDIATASGLSKHFPWVAGVLFGLATTFFMVTPFSLIVHGVHWPRSLIVIAVLSIPCWVLAVFLVRWNGSPGDDGDAHGDGGVSS